MIGHGVRNRIPHPTIDGGRDRIVIVDSPPWRRRIVDHEGRIDDRRIDVQHPHHIRHCDIGGQHITAIDIGVTVGSRAGPAIDAKLARIAKGRLDDFLTRHVGHIFRAIGHRVRRVGHPIDRTERGVIAAGGRRIRRAGVRARRIGRDQTRSGDRVLAQNRARRHSAVEADYHSRIGGQVPEIDRPGQAVARHRVANGRVVPGIGVVRSAPSADVLAGGHREVGTPGNLEGQLSTGHRMVGGDRQAPVNPGGARRGQRSGLDVAVVPVIDLKNAGVAILGPDFGDIAAIAIGDRISIQIDHQAAINRIVVLQIGVQHRFSGPADGAGRRLIAADRALISCPGGKAD